MVPVNFQERVASGDIPEDAAEITAGCKQLLRVNSRVSQTVAVCIAKMYEALDLREWVNWCRDELGLDSVSYRSHLAKVGKLLLSLLRDESALPTYTRLFECDVMKLLALARAQQLRILRGANWCFSKGKSGCWYQRRNDFLKNIWYLICHRI